MAVLLRIHRSWKAFRRDPVFGRAWPGAGRANVFVHPGQPEWLTRLIELHEAGHLAGLKGGFRLSVMFEAPGRVRDTWLEKALLVLAAPFIVLARIARNDWFTRAERAELHHAAALGDLSPGLRRILGV